MERHPPGWAAPEFIPISPRRTRQIADSTVRSLLEVGGRERRPASVNHPEFADTE